MRRVLAVLLVLGAMSLGAPGIFAYCGIITPVGHPLGSFFANCPDAAPVMAYAYLLSNAAAPAPNASNTNSGITKIECEAFDPNNNCYQPSGVAGDGLVTIETDWIDPFMNGCITPGDRIVIVVQANDGTGALVSIDGATTQLAFPYDVETAQPFDPSDPLATSLGIAPFAAARRMGVRT